MALIDSGTIAMTGGEDVLPPIGGGGAFVAQFDFTEMVAGDTIVIRWKPEILFAAVEAQAQSWEIEHGATLSDQWVGTFGTNAVVFDTGVIWTPGTASLTLEQTVGTVIDVPYQIWQP